MRLLKRSAVGLFIVAVPLALIGTNARVVINAPVLYSYGFDRYDIPYWTGIERGELLSGAGQIRDYFNNNDEFLDLKVFVGGIRRSLYSEREVLHMRDVKGLVKGVSWVEEIALAYLAIFAVVGLVATRRRFLESLGRYLSLGGLVTAGFVLAVGLASLLFFDLMFLAFHLVSFSNDFWQLDPSRDYLIAMFPRGFFFDATLTIAVLTVTQAAIITVVPGYFLWWRPRRSAARLGYDGQPREGLGPTPDRPSVHVT